MTAASMGAPSPTMVAVRPADEGVPPLFWVDTHVHLDAAEFDADRDRVLARARAAGVHGQVLPAVAMAHFPAVQQLARTAGLHYALGVHPLYVRGAPADALAQLDAALDAARDDPALVAVGEIGLDFFVDDAVAPRALQQTLFEGQLALAKAHALPVLLHVRRSVDAVSAALRRAGVRQGIAHAFNGSAQQAARLVDWGLHLGFGGAMTFPTALQLRARAAEVPAEALVLETDSPDIPPQWRYVPVAERAQRPADAARNEPAELPRIAQTLAELRGWSLAETAARTTANAAAALPRAAAAWCAGGGVGTTAATEPRGPGSPASKAAAAAVALPPSSSRHQAGRRTPAPREGDRTGDGEGEGE